MGTLDLMNFTYLESAWKFHSFDVCIVIKIPFFRVLLTIGPIQSLLNRSLTPTVWLIHKAWTDHLVHVFLRPILWDFHELNGLLFFGTKDSLLKACRTFTDSAAGKECIALTTETWQCTLHKLAWFCRNWITRTVTALVFIDTDSVARKVKSISLCIVLST